jgi:hypothetical protein
MLSLYYWEDFLTEVERSKLDKCMDLNAWKFGHYSMNLNTNTKLFWKQPLDNNSDIIKTIFQNKIEDIVKRYIIINEFYANGQSYGQCGTVHTDISTADGRDVSGQYGTLVYFYEKDWKPVYGGHLLIVNKDETEVLQSIFPKTNSAVMFDSTLNHVGLEPTSYCTKLRISVATKFKII